jgi:hypothetical protein
VDVQLRGQHDVDRKWIEDVKNNNADDSNEASKPKIMPRFLFEVWNAGN